MVGGPIKAYFSEGAFDRTARQDYERLVEFLRCEGAIVFNAPEYERFAVVPVPSQAVTERDFSWCQAADLYVCLWPTGASGQPIPSQGTAIELGWVSMFRRPVVLLWDAPNALNYSHLIRGLDSITNVAYVDLKNSYRTICNEIQKIIAFPVRSN